MSVGIENIFNLSNGDARKSSAERLHTYVQTHTARLEDAHSTAQPAIVAHTADAADAATVAPADRAPAAGPRNARAVGIVVAATTCHAHDAVARPQQPTVVADRHGPP
jgi:hypothetical protein